MGLNKEKGNQYLSMEIVFKENGLKEKNMEQEYGKLKKDNITLENGEKIEWRDTVL